MTFLELAVTGIRHFGGFTRIPLKPGMNTVWGGNQSGKTTLWQVLRQLLVRDRRLAATDDVEQWGRAALTFQGEDGGTYCMARQFSEPGVRLARHRPGEGFVPEELPGAGRGPADPEADGDPSLWSACVGGAAWLPSTRLRPSRNGRSLPPGAVREALEGRHGTPGGTGLDLVPSGLAVERAAAERRLEALHGVEADARRAGEMEFELAAAYDRHALLSAHLEAAAQAVRERAAAADELADMEDAAGMPDDLEAEAREFEAELEAVQDAQQAIEAEVAELIDDLDRIPPVRPLRSPGLYLGAAFTAAGGVSLQVAAWHPVTYGLFALAALTAGVLVYRVAAVRQRRAALIGQIDGRTEAGQAAEAELLQAHVALFERLRAAGVVSTHTFIRQRERHRHLSARLERLAAREAEALDGRSFESLEEECARVAERIAALEDALEALQVSGADAEAARREHLALARVLKGEAPAEDGAKVLDLSIEPHLEADPALRDVLDRRRDQYCARAGVYLSRFTGGEVTGLSINGGYRPTLHTEREGTVSAGHPGAGMVDLIYLAQYLAMVETLDPAGRFPMVLDEPFLSLDPERRTLLYETLRETARRRQVLVFTCQQFLTSPGDHLVRLKG